MNDNCHEKRPKWKCVFFSVHNCRWRSCTNFAMKRFVFQFWVQVILSSRFVLLFEVAFISVCPLTGNCKWNKFHCRVKNQFFAFHRNENNRAVKFPFAMRWWHMETTQSNAKLKAIWSIFNWNKSALHNKRAHFCCVCLVIWNSFWICLLLPSKRIVDCNRIWSMRHATKVIRIVAVERIESMEIVEFNENKKYENEEEENGTRKQAFQCVANLKIVLPQHRKTELLRTKKIICTKLTVILSLKFNVRAKFQRSKK